MSDHLTTDFRCAACAVGRKPSDISLLAVSKTKPLSDIEMAIAAGQTAFGENYVQEGVDKCRSLAVDRRQRCQHTGYPFLDSVEKACW